MATASALQVQIVTPKQWTQIVSRSAQTFANIEVKLTADGTRWYVVACSAYIANAQWHAFPPGEFFSSQDAAITAMKRRIMDWFKGNGRKETEEKVEWRVP